MALISQCLGYLAKIIALLAHSNSIESHFLWEWENNITKF